MIDFDCNFIISAFPDSPEKEKDLLEIIGSIKSLGGYVTLISHLDCSQEIKDIVDLYLYNSKNEISYKDSDILDPAILKNVYCFPNFNWVNTGDIVYRDYKGWIGYTPSIVNLLMPAISSAFSRKHDFVVYMEADFIFPKEFDIKINSLCTELNSIGRSSLFYRVPNSPWLHGHLFIIRLDLGTYLTLPFGRYDTNRDFIEKFPNYVFEDFLCEIESRTKSIVKTRDDLNQFFGGEIKLNWDTHKWQWSKSDFMLYTNSDCSLFVDQQDLSSVRLFVNLKTISHFQKAEFRISIKGPGLDLHSNYILNRGEWSWERVVLDEAEDYIIDYTISSEDISVGDSYVVKGNQLEYLSRIRNFVKS